MGGSALEKAFEDVQRLVATFSANEKRYLSADYQEAEARKDFIDKFWTALGWDVNHDRQTNPYEQEVKVERSTAGGGQRRADYAFYLAPNFHDVRFIVEAKKPAVGIETSESYFQVIRYGWNNDNPLAVLTDFGTLHVIDSRYEPDLKTALHRAVAKYHYTDYTKPDEFAKIYWRFSREAVADDSLEKYAKELPKPRGKAVQRGLFPGGYRSVDESFLAELDEHRTALARTFKNRNPRLDGETLTEIAQRTLDRLVFLRFLEDKGIEGQRLVDRFGEKGTAWGDFVAASRRLDGIYNGIVFRHHDILDADNFRVDDKVFADICESLAHINSPYDFNAIPIHILGSIYERFLGKVIVATAQRARVEEKPEVRKAGGVYYTPAYIVRYIVENTVGKLVAGKTPEQIAAMRFADIACGSGSFLLGVFDLLLDYHGRYYNENPRKARRGDCVERDGRLYLSLHKKREILLNNICGVDIDAQAVEVCQFSLYLKLLQEETEASAHQYLLDFVHTERMQRLLPDLGKNIVCGNSLLGTDILDGQLFARDEERALNPMNFEDVFPEIIRRGGFDAVVGNPPYVSNDTLPDSEKVLYQTRYLTGKKFDLYQCFIERGAKILRDNGRYGMILPNTFLTGKSYTALRKYLLEHLSIFQIVDLPQGVFRGVTVDNVLFFYSKSVPSRAKVTVNLLHEKSDKSRVGERDWDDSYVLPQSELGRGDFCTINLALTPLIRGLFSRIESDKKRLGDYFDVCDGLIPYKTAKDAEASKFTAFERREGWGRLLRGKDIARYQVNWRGEYIKYGDHLWCKRKERFFKDRKVLLHAIRNKSLPRRLVGSLDYDAFYNTDNLINVIQHAETPSLEFLLGLLNSSLVNFWYKLNYPNVNINPNELRTIPIPRVDTKNHSEMVTKVAAMLDGKKQLAKARIDKDKTYYEKKCAALDRQIDRLVYNLYGLSEEEIAIVEEAVAT